MPHLDDTPLTRDDMLALEARLVSLRDDIAWLGLWMIRLSAVSIGIGLATFFLLVFHH